MGRIESGQSQWIWRLSIRAVNGSLTTRQDSIDTTALPDMRCLHTASAADEGLHVVRGEAFPTAASGDGRPAHDG